VTDKTPESIKDCLAGDVADLVVGLINTQPATPTKETVAALVRKELDHWALVQTHESVWRTTGQQRVEALVRELWDAVVAQWEEIARGNPALAQRAKELARAEQMFPQDDDLYMVVMGTRDCGPAFAKKKTVMLQFPIQPQWALYIDEALRQLALEASSPTSA